MTEKRVLVLGYGNPGLCDDGLGPALAARVESLNIPGVRVETANQLNVEDAATVAEYDVVVFLDACLCAPPPYFLRTLEPRTGTREFTTHSLAPEGVLGLVRDVFAADTKGYAMAVRGYDFHSYGDQLTPEATDNLEAALAFLAEAVAPGGALDSGRPLAGTDS